MLAEKEILSAYLPTQLGEAQLEEIISTMVAELPEKSMKMMGQIMGKLNKAHGGAFDGKVASEIVKRQLG